MTAKFTPLVCPRCGNTTEQEGITHCYLEWRISPVKGVCGDKVAVDFDSQEGADIDKGVKVTMTNTPNVTEDLDHLFCNRCEWNWYDGRETDDAAYCGR